MKEREREGGREGARRGSKETEVVNLNLVASAIAQSGYYSSYLEHVHTDKKLLTPFYTRKKVSVTHLMSIQ